MQNVDVVVVGAGPVGLLTAVELRLGGLRTLVLERLVSPSTTIKALGVGPLGAETLQRRGMAAAIAAEEERNLEAMAQAGSDMRGRMSKFAGHFAGLPLTRTDSQNETGRRMHAVDQQGLEAVLGARARALGVDVRRGCEVTGLVQRADGVDVAWDSPTGKEHLRCAYLVGCDGGRSTIRKLAGFAFPGTPPTMTMYQAIAAIDHPERLPPAGWCRTPNGVFDYGRFPKRLFMLDFSGPPADRQAPVTAGEVEAVLRRISGADVRIETLEVANRWTDNTRLVDSYRRGRVLLAGDAAHIHSPFGGQGLSLGLVDAANLGWKLAAVVRGDAPESLLETYTAERRPVAEAVLANTLAQVAIMRPDPQSGALREIMAKLLRLDDVNRFFVEMMSGVSTPHDLGSTHGDVGRLVADRPIWTGSAEVSLFDLMRDGKGVLLDASDGKASEIVAAATSRIHCVQVAADASMLIRPDACVAWSSRAQDDVLGLEAALARWFVERRQLAA